MFHEEDEDLPPDPADAPDDEVPEAEDDPGVAAAEDEAEPPSPGTYDPAYPRMHFEPATPEAAAWPTVAAMLKALETRARETHGLAEDKTFMQTLHGYLTYHLTEAGFLE